MAPPLPATLPASAPQPPAGATFPSSTPDPLPQADAEPLELLFLDETLAQALQQQTRLQAAGMQLLRRQVLSALGGVMSTYRAPDAAQHRRWSMPPEGGEPNHRYRPPGDRAKLPDTARQARDLVAWVSRAQEPCGGGVRLGLIDTAVDTSHPLLRGARVESTSLLPAGVAPADTTHGTAVVSVWVGGQGTPALLPAAQVWVAAVMRLREGQADSTAEWLIRGLDHLAAQQVHVINLSLGGPHNRWLAEVLRRAQSLGIGLAAAAGNGGARAPAPFPASHPSVVAVTSVDVQRRIDTRAQRGTHIALAAPGVDLPLAGPQGGLSFRTGSSFAAPFVAAALALGWDRQTLQAQAQDLGEPGWDPVFGWGLLHLPGDCTARR
jgi:hypothetical protein